MKGSEVLFLLKRLLALCLAVIISVAFVGCDPIDEDYGTSEVVSTEDSTDAKLNNNNADTAIMSLDRVMSNYFDISLFDEENYADIYLGKKFKIDAKYNDDIFEVPVKLKKLAENGWTLADGNSYDEKSLVFSYESVDVTLEDENGNTVAAQLFNSSRSSKHLSECNVVKFSIENDYYANVNDYNAFNINGITNSMAITDIINVLGTPSHFYAVSDTCYYLDYFITKRDRRNGITVYINPVDDLITKIEFSYYK